MGRMKDIAIDIQDLQEVAVTAEDEEAFMMYVTNAGWISPTEQSSRAYQAGKLLDDLSDSERIAVNRVLEAVGVVVPTVDLHVKSGDKLHN